MPPDISQDYETLKTAILQAYELTPEAYRMKFRSWIKQDKQTHIEFSREQSIWFDKWAKATNCTGDYKKLREIILIEQFKNRVSENMKIYLAERKLPTLYETAMCADEYVLIHAQSRCKQEGEQFSKIKIDTEEDKPVDTMKSTIITNTTQ